MSLVTLPNFDPTPGSASIELSRLPLSPLMPTAPARHPVASLHSRRITCLDDPSLPAVLGLWRRSFPERERAPLSCWVGRLNEYAPGPISRRNLIAATLPSDGRPVGMAYYEVRRGGDGESPVGYLVYLATDPGFRGQGMGTLLYREVVARMFAAGCRAVVFEVEIPGEVGRFCPEDGEMARRRMFWYRRNGARCLNGAVAVAGIGGPQPLPEAVMIHPRPGDPAEHCPESALACARIALGAAAVERTHEPLALL